MEATPGLSELKLPPEKPGGGLAVREACKAMTGLPRLTEPAGQEEPPAEHWLSLLQESAQELSKELSTTAQEEPTQALWLPGAMVKVQKELVVPGRLQTPTLKQASVVVQSESLLQATVWLAWEALHWPLFDPPPEPRHVQVVGVPTGGKEGEAGLAVPAVHKAPEKPEDP